MHSPSSRSLCPRCGSANRCTLAAGEPFTHCWCRQAKIDASRPGSAERLSCFCPRCVSRMAEEERELSRAR